MIYAYKKTSPVIPESVFVAENATIIGDVEIGKESSIWFQTVIRGDVNTIRIGDRTNIQDGSVLHVTYQKWPLSIGHDVTVGHGAILHGCTIQDCCLIGMGAQILDGATIGEFSVVAAGSLVMEGVRVPPRSLVAGVPAIAKRSLLDEEVQRIQEAAARYVAYKNEYMTGAFTPVERKVPVLASPVPRIDEL